MLLSLTKLVYAIFQKPIKSNFAFEVQNENYKLTFKPNNNKKAKSKKNNSF